MKRLVLVAALYAAPASADSEMRLTPERPLDFSLRISQHSLDLDYGGPVVDTTVDRIGVAWRERFGPALQLGLLGGYSFLTQGNNAVTAGRELSGYHAGFSLDLDLPASERLGVFLGATWLYQKVDDDDGAQRIVISWSEPSVRFGVSGLLAGRLRAYGGVRYGAIDGQQRLSGALNETRDIEQTDRTGAFAGLALLLEDDGYVGVTAESGIDRTAAVYFGRRF